MLAVVVGDDRPALDLRPDERAIPSWKPLAALPEQEPPPFDPRRLRPLLRYGRYDYGWWHWRRSPIGPVMTEREAAFWLTLTRPDRRTGRQTATDRFDVAVRGPERMSAQETLHAASETDLPAGDALLPLITLAGTEAGLEAVMRPLDRSRPWAVRRRAPSPAPAPGRRAARPARGARPCRRRGRPGRRPSCSAPRSSSRARSASTTWPSS